MKNKGKIYTDCVNVYLEGEICMKFAQYHIDNWNDMPCFRGGGLQGGNYYHCTFFKEALPLINKFFKENNIQEMK